MTVGSSAACRWAVSTRTRGEVQTAAASTPRLELVLLGVPAALPRADAESWLHDLANVALETSSDDARSRAIPALLHHALTGLLFSQAELWNLPGAGEPCSAAFVDTDAGAAFGWVGEADAEVLIDGATHEPQWVLVRDEKGREARAAVLPAERHAMVSIAFWPAARDGGEAPVSIEAEWVPSESTLPVALPAPEQAPRPVATPEPPAERAAAVGPLPAELQDGRPGLANAHVDAFAPEAAAIAPVASELSAALSPEEIEAMSTLTEPRPRHPVAAWLGRMLQWGRKAGAPTTDPVPAAHDAVSAYDTLLSESVPGTPPAEQTSLELPPEPPPLERMDDAIGGPDAFDEELAQAPTTPEMPPLVQAAPEPVAPEPEPVAPVPAHPSVAIANEGAPTAPPEPVRAADVPAAPVLADPPPIAAEPPAPVLAIPTLPAEPAPAPEPAPPLALDPAPTPHTVHEARVAALRNADAATLPVLRSAPAPAPSEPLAIEREPEAADPAFVRPHLPSRPAAPEGPPVLRVAVPQPPAAPPAPAQPPAAPPVLRVPSASAPPMLRVQVPGRTPDAPPVLRVGPGAPAPVIVPTPPVLPVTDVLVPAAPAAAAPAAADAGATGASVHTRWPQPRELERPVRRVPRAARVWGAIVLGVFGVGWLLGVLMSPTAGGEPGPFTKFLRAIGLGGAHYTVALTSNPAGAWIAIDGKDAARRTPATLDLPPGGHTLTLSLPDLGAIQVPVKGARGDRMTLEPSLAGGLEVLASDAGVPIKVALDGKALGYAPVSLDDVAPGLHEVQFSGPGMPAWAQTVQVGVQRTVQIVARPMSAPSNGVIQVQATLNDEQGATPLSGAQVWVDGDLRGVTPTSLDLPRGPHSIRLTYRGETAPVQVIDLPGGNQRFASFAFGLDSPSPQVQLLAGVHPARADQTVMVSATLTGLTTGDVREAWLHVRTPDGLWRRYPMTAMAGASGPVVAAVFPSGVYDAAGTSRWYVSTTTLQGDEYFSEMQLASVTAAAAPRRHAPATPAPASTPAH